MLTNYAGADLYYVLIAGDTILGYGMLRGWDAGYEVPSLGIAIHPQYRGSGLGKLLMQFLHCAARWKGATQIRLKVYPDNPRAIKLYQQLGYAFGKMEHEQLVGIATL
ncbi:MAG: GNAT family N-acetyltransferase [Chloroflexia bacterium]